MSSRREKAIVYSLGALQKIFRFFCVLSWRSLLWRTVCERTLDCVFDRGGCNNRAIVNAWLGLDGGLLSGFISQSLFPPLSFSRAHILCQRVVVSVCVCVGFNALRCSGVSAGLDSSECVSQVSVSLWSDGDDGWFRIRMSVSLTACVCF